MRSFRESMRRSRRERRSELRRDSSSACNDASSRSAPQPERVVSASPARLVSTVRGAKSGCCRQGFCATILEPQMAAAGPKFYPTTSGVSLRDLGAAVVPLARNVASIQVPGLRAQSTVFASWTVTLACNLVCSYVCFYRSLLDQLHHS